jgi:protein-S-isoprenylcysteine O-methyltransferase Ste14
VGVLAFIWWMNTLQIAPEERALQETFGAELGDYKAKVRRWL